MILHKELAYNNIIRKKSTSIKVSLKEYLKTFLIMLVFISIACGGFSISVNADEDIKLPTRPKILFLSSYHASFPTFSYQLEGLKSVLAEKDYQIDIEYMDTKRFYTAENLNEFNTRLEYKLSFLDTYDVILAGDDNALQYAMDNRNTIFKDIPIVFLGINDYMRAIKACEMDQVTGVAEISSIHETLELSFQLLGNVEELVIICDDSLTGLSELNQVLAYQEIYPDIIFRVEDLSEITYDTLGQNISELELDSALLLLAAYTDKEDTYKTFYEYLSLIKEDVQVPIFHLYEFGIGEGLLGGVVVDYIQQGRQAGLIIEKIISGENINDISPIMDSSLNSTIIDYKELLKYNLDASLLPIDVIYINKPVSLLDENKEAVIVVAAIITMLVIIILILIFSIQRRKQVELELQNSNEELTALYEQMMAINEELEAQEEELRDSYEQLTSKTRLLEESEERYKYVFDLSHSGLWERNIETNNLYMTKEWYRTLLEEKGYKDIYKMSISSIMDLFYNQIDNEQIRRLQQLQGELLEGKRASYNLVFKCCKKGKNPFYIEEKARSVYNSEGKLIRIVGSHINITSAIVYEQQLEEFAYKDQLTKIPNRIILEQVLQKIFNVPDRESVSGAVLLIDIDNFKFINNTYGHEIGDELLQLIAKRLYETINDDFTLGRISGDEFVVICNGVHKQEKISEIANSLILLFDERFKLRDRSIYITVSVGIAIYPENGSDLDILLNRGNNAMMEAKSKGKNRFDYYDTSMNEMMENKIYIQNNIREAIEHNHFELYYQPIYSVESNKVIGYEALTRWHDEIKGFIPPLDFIVVAEKMGLINKLGEWVMKEAAKFIKGINTENKEHKYISINVSSVQILQNNFVEKVLDIVNESEVDFRDICIELTETALMQSFEKNAAKLALLRDKGIRVSLDDFGTGYSSLNYLRRLPVDILKIDKSFIDGLMDSKEDRQLTEGIILLAQKMGIYVIAEGIELLEQFKQLKEFNCDGIQGYLISRPMPESQVSLFIESEIGIDTTL